MKDNHLWHQQTKYESEKISPLSSIGEMPLWTKAFLYISLINLLVASAGNMLISTFPFYISNLGGTVVTVGVVSGLYSFCALIMRPFAGWFMDNKSRKTLFFLATVFLALIPLLYQLLPILIMIIALRCLHGLMWSAATTSSNTNACDIIPCARFGEGMAYFGLTNSLSVAVAPALGMLIMEEFGFPALFIISSALSVITLFFLSHLKLNKIIRSKQSFEITPYITRIVRLFNKDALPAATITFLLSVPGGAIFSFVTLFAATEDIGNGGLFFTFQAVFAGLSRLFSGKLADSKGEGPLVCASIIFFTAGLFFVVFCHSALQFYIAASLMGLGYGVSIPALQAMAVRIVPVEKRGSASSTFLCSWDIAWALGGILGGVLIDSLGYREMFAILSLFELLATLYYYFYGRKSPSAFKVVQAANQKKSTSEV